jgi:V/A-type H+-transporting ATPase subunit E
MEELRSTEILDKEIEADARKKAEKILARAEEESSAILSDVTRRVEEASKKKEAFYSEKLSQIEKSVEESLPLEKGRFLVSFYDQEVSKAFNEYFESLGEEKRLALIEKKLRNLPQSIFEKKNKRFCFRIQAVRSKKTS